MHLLAPDINAYLEGLLPERDPILLEMEELADRENFPIVGPLVGRLFAQLVQMIQGRRIFEMGSGFGYSAFWMAQALPDGGKIICSEGAVGNIEKAKAYFTRGGLLDRVEFREGDALEIIQQIEGQFDLIMNDVDKEQYPDVVQLAVPRLRKGGILLTDNLLWHGRVLDDNPDRATRAVVNYTRSLYDSKHLWTTILPLRDGVGLSLKLS